MPPPDGQRSRRSGPCDRSAPRAGGPGPATVSMNAERREFVDANVLVYAFDASAGARQARAGELLERLWTDGNGCVSVQVLQEFFVTVTRKVAKPLKADEAERRVRELCAWRVFAPKAEDVLSAIALHQRAKISFWDAMIVEAAHQLGCDTLWTEDLSHGQDYDGVRVENPFRGISASAPPP